MISCGVPQGSVLEPVLWNIYLDNILSAEVPEDTEILCYADDTAIIVMANSNEKSKIKAERAYPSDRNHEKKIRNCT